MNFTVYWRPRAQVQLAKMWDQIGDTDAVEDAADAVNRILRDAAHEQGESRDRPTRRLWFHPPLCVHFEIDSTAGVVYVNDIQWVG